MIFLLLQIFIFVIKTNSWSGFKCRYGLDTYETFEKRKDPDHIDYCHLCECNIMENWDCKLYTTCASLTCTQAKPDEARCCEMLECMGIYFF